MAKKHRYLCVPPVVVSGLVSAYKTRVVDQDREWFCDCESQRKATIGEYCWQHRREGEVR